MKLAELRAISDPIIQQRADACFADFISDLPRRLELAAKEGKTDLIVIDDIGFVECTQVFWWYSLSGFAKQIFDHCKKNGWKPKIECGGYADCTYQMVISW